MSNSLKQFALLLAITLLIVGCAGTAESLRSGASGSTTFTVTGPLPEVFNIIKEQALACNPGTVSSNFTTFVGAIPVLASANVTWYVNPILSQDKKSAEIQFFNHNGGIESHFMIVDLSVLPSNETQVKTYYKFSAWRSAAENVEGWVKGTSHSCWVKS